MPFFDHPANADWLLPIVKIPLTVISLVFDFIRLIGPIGNVALIAIVIAIYAKNIMGPAHE